MVEAFTSRRPARDARVAFACVSMGLIAGCWSGPGAARPPKIDAQAAGRIAIEQLDSDGDGLLGTAELAASPGLLQAIDRYDSNGDGRVSAEEISQRIAEWQEDGTGIVLVNCTLVLEGRPLQGALVRLAPEPFLGEAIRSAEGVTGNDGQARLKIADADLPSHLRGVPGIALGLYRVEITHPTVQLPPEFNTNTTLGVEIGHDSSLVQAGRFTIALGLDGQSELR